MFKLFRRDPLEKLEKQYAKKLEEALAAQRGGKMPRYAELTAEAEAIREKIDAQRADSGPT